MVFFDKNLFQENMVYNAPPHPCANTSCYRPENGSLKRYAVKYSELTKQNQELFV